MPKMQALLDSLHEAFGFPTAIIDNESNVLTASGWQDACTGFHRANPTTRLFCTESDRYILSHVGHGEQSVCYRCPMGLIDSATAIVIDGKHLGNAFIGQLFLEAPDPRYFREQAERFGFDEEKYLEAISRIPVISSDQLAKRLAFIREFAEMLAEFGLARLREKEANKVLHRYQESLEIQVAQRTAELQETNLHLQEEMQERQQAQEALQEQAAFLEEQAALLEEEITERRQSQEALQEQTIILEEEIAQRRQAQEAQMESKRFLKTIIESEPECVKMLDRDGKLLMMNRAGLSMIQADSFDQVEGRCVYPMIAEPYRDAFAAVTKDVFQGKPGSLEFEIVGLKGRHLWLDTGAVPFLNDAGEVDALLSITRDITERKALEAQLFQAQKMEAVGHLAGGISHDFNNILTAIIGFASLVDMKMAADDPQRINLKHILSSAERAADLTRSLLAFSRKQIIDPKPMDLNMIVRSKESFLQRIIGEDVELKTELSDSELIVSVDCGQMEQVLMNLVSNARDAMPDGGMLSISTEAVLMEKNFINAHGYGKPGNYALMHITDTGTGMSKADCERVFEPFFTTKAVGKGTGLGLSVVYGIIKQHSGYINIYSEPGVGTTFTIYLPTIVATIEKQADTPEVEPKGGSETILVVDDDAPLRELAENVLTQFGYRVITAVDGRDAVCKFREAVGSIQLVIMDIVMPQQNGKEAFDEIRTLCSNCKVLFMSGYAADIVHRRGVVDHGLEFISKPLRPMQLLKKVREILDDES